MARSRERANPAVTRALRAAEDREPWLPPGFVWWVLGRVVAMALLAGAAYLIYDWASSDQFEVHSVNVEGNVLLSAAEVRSVAAVDGANIFWINHGLVAARLAALPLIQSVEVSATLPAMVDIRIVERRPAGFWTSGDQSYLVDGEGVILKAVDVETQQARACAGQPCDPRLATLPNVAQVASLPTSISLTPGDRVDASALSTSARLTSLLPGVGIQPVSFEWSPENGLEVSTRDGWRARFDQRGNLDQQVAALRSIRDQLARAKAPPTLIDVRFGDRPYFR